MRTQFDFFPNIMLKYQKFGLVGVILIVLSILFLFIGFDSILKFGIRNVSIYFHFTFPSIWKIKFLNIISAHLLK